MYRQATSVPWSPDVLRPTARLLAALEFGTNVTKDIGDFFAWDGGAGPNYQASMNAELGMLDVTVDDTPPAFQDRCRGQSFEFPPPSKWTELSDAPGSFACLVYAHLYHRMFDPLGTVTITTQRSQVLLGNESALLGTIPAARRTALALNHWVPDDPVPAPPATLTPGPAIVEAVGTVADVPITYMQTFYGQSMHIHWCVACVYDGGADAIAFNPRFSPDGVGWHLGGAHAIPAWGGPGEPLRVAVATCGAFNTSLLDWARIYAPATASLAAVIPDIPENGGRLFVG